MEKRERANAKTGLGPLEWAQEYLPHFFSDEPCDFHRELMNDLKDPGLRLIARVGPRGHAKSTCAAFAFPLWCLCERQRRNILIITHERGLATQFLRDIRAELEANEKLIDAYGELCAPEDSDPKDGTIENKGQPRRRRAARRSATQTQFVTRDGITIQAKGSGASLRGTRVGPQRPDLIICDDIEKDQHVRSRVQRRKLEHWLRKVVMPALAPGGRLVMLGSILHHDSLLARLADRSQWPRWDYRVYRAREAEQIGETDEYRMKALWPARWPLEKLDEERARIGTLAFEQEYMANPIDDARRVFKPESLRRYDESELVPERLVTLVCVDPAVGKSNGDYFALWVGSVDQSTGVIYTRELNLERIGIVEQVRRILAAFERWRPARIGIEVTAYQDALRQVLEHEASTRGIYLPVVEIRTLTNKIARIEGASTFFENGMFQLPKALDPEVEAQFLNFPSDRHDDAPDVCAMAIELAGTFRSLIRVETLRNDRSEQNGRAAGW